jgi:hypothetical protein
MPSSNVNLMLGTGAVIVVTVVAAAAIAVYESPEVRQFAEQCRRRIAIALHSLGDEIHPRRESESQQPRFNRPEDAEGFMQSSAESGVDADEDSKRRQREELMYWNSIRLENFARDKQRAAKNQIEGRTFDDFLHEDRTAEKGTYVYNSGADVRVDIDDGFIRRRGEGVRGLNRSAIYANPFADENYIEMSEQHSADRSLMSPNHSEIVEDIYGTSDDGRQTRQSTETLAHEEQLVDVSENTSTPAVLKLTSSPQELATNSYHEYATTENANYPEGAFASIHAWADDSQGHPHTGFYSPLPVTPQAPLSEVSEPEHLSGEATPTDSVSLAGTGEDIGCDNASSVGGARDYDILSEDGEDTHTPGSWSEVGSVVSETEYHTASR